MRIFKIPSGNQLQIIAHLPQSELEKIPAGAPPPGVQPNFSNPPSLVPAVLGVGATFLFIALFCFALRVLVKVSDRKLRSWDDVTCTLGFVRGINEMYPKTSVAYEKTQAFSLTMYAGIVMGCAHGALGRHVWDLHLSQQLNNYSVDEDFITTTMSVPALGLIKMSLFIQYYSLFWPLRWVRISALVGGTVSSVFYFSVSIVAFVLCSPWPGQSMLDGLISWHYAKYADFSIPMGVVGMVIDIYLVVLPIKAVSTLNMNTNKKVGLMIIFMTGIIASIASIAGLVYRIKLQQDITDASWRVAYVHIWGQVETFAGVACSSMPSVYALFTQHKFSFERLRHVQGSLEQLLRSKLGRNTFTSSGNARSVPSTEHKAQGSSPEIEPNDARKDRDEKCLESPRILLRRDISVVRDEGPNMIGQKTYTQPWDEEVGRPRRT